MRETGIRDLACRRRDTPQFINQDARRNYEARLADTMIALLRRFAAAPRFAALSEGEMRAEYQGRVFIFNNACMLSAWSGGTNSTPLLPHFRISRPRLINISVLFAAALRTFF